MIDSRNRAAFTLGHLRKQLEGLPDTTLVTMLPDSAGEDLGKVCTVFIQFARPEVVVFRCAPRAENLLFDAVSRDDRDLVSKLVAEGADVDGQDPRGPPFDGATPLSVAAEEGLLEMTRMLLQLGANANARSASGWTALMRACNADQLDAACILLEGGADPSLANDEGYTARGRTRAGNKALLTLLENWEAAQQAGATDGAPGLAPLGRAPRG
jgi:hypothetical protein